MIIIAQAPPAAPLSISNTVAQTQTFVVQTGNLGGGTQCNLNMPGSNRLLGLPYTVRASGLITIAGTQTFGTSAAVSATLYLVGGTPGFVSSVLTNSGTLLNLTLPLFFTQAAVTGSIACPFEIEFQGVGGANIISGAAQGWAADINGKVTVQNRVTNNPSSNPITPGGDVAEPPAQFAVALVNPANTNISGTITATLNALVLES